MSMDETGWHENQRRAWLSTVVGTLAILFAVRASRSRKAVEELLGETFAGIVRSDVLAATFSVVETCRPLGRDVQTYLHEAITAHFQNHPAPRPINHTP